jgi:UDP-glucose 4-epimerase
MNILITGGCGYIGSHIFTIHRKNVILLDNFLNSDQNIFKNFNKKPIIKKGDINNTSLIAKIIKNNNISCIIHLAALKSVRESAEKPQEYFYNNLSGTISIIKAMLHTGCKNIIFSSTAALYKEPKKLPIYETSAVSKKLSPYAQSKLMAEQILEKVAKLCRLNVVVLRYFNVAGAHPKNSIGELPKKNFDNLFPSLLNSIFLKKPLNIFGNKYKTKDGTAIRDYIHVMDVARAHILSINFLKRNSGFFLFNIGSGSSQTVLDIVNEFNLITKNKIKINFKNNRIGDNIKSLASIKKAKKMLNWEPKYKIKDICKTAYNWHLANNKES